MQNMLQKTRPETGRGNFVMLMLVVFAGYLVFGISENLKGPALPAIQSEFGVGETRMGLALSLNSIGFLIACTFAGLFVRRYGIKAACAAAFACMAASGWLIGAAGQFYAFAFGYFFLNLWNGLLEIVLALLSARIFTKYTGTMMNLSHFFYGLSSTAAPLAATGLMGASYAGGAELGWRGMFAALLSLCALPLVPTLLARFPRRDGESHEAPLAWRDYIRDPIAWFVIVLLSFGVVAELAVGSWLVNFLEKSYRWDRTDAAGMLSAFFLCFTVARLVLGPVADKFGFVKSMILFAAASAVCTLLSVAIGEPAAALFALSGFGIAPIYPTAMALLAKLYPRGSDTAITFTVIMVGLAGVASNFVIGGVSEWFGLRAGFWLIGGSALCCAFAGFALYRYLSRRGRLV
ncbi:MFS transporter [Cohnella nanjingensis]|uniref:MFS transporter n=1 Tax=Cohnella nanjingensis TaxID=1387779 RepID=A0A7X0RWJ1_9BACL|nr:MFS transporter [Cohnella nanjingensis]MBB6674953.1 MFS transporter [Cohnella nanjingensis]